MFNIVCFGDTNTWGYDNRSGNRLPYTERWTGILSERRVGGHRGIYRTWPDAEHIPPSPHFHTFSSMKHADIYEFGKN